MPQVLSNLTIREVSLVDKPANAETIEGTKIPRARIALFKRDSGDGVQKASYGIGTGAGISQGGGGGRGEGEGVGGRDGIGGGGRSGYVGAADTSDGEWDDEDPLCKSLENLNKDGKTRGGETYPKGDWAYAPSENSSDWKLRIKDHGKPDAGIVGAAVAALGKGFRGKKVQIPAEALAGVKAKVRAAWRAANADKDISEMPSVLRKGETQMTIAEIEARVTKQDADLAALLADNAVLKSENDLVLKMSKKERKLYASMDTEKRKRFVAAAPEKRKGMLEDEATCKRERELTDSMDNVTKAEYTVAGASQRAILLEKQEELMAKAAEDAEKAAAKKAKSPSPKDDEEEDGKPEPDEDDVEEKRAKKALTMKVAKAEDIANEAIAKLAVIEKREKLLHFVEIAKTDLSHTSGNDVEKGTRLMKAADAFGGEQSEDFRKHMEDLKAADVAVARMYREVGKSGGAIPADKALDAKCVEISKRDKISIEKAYIVAASEVPELFMDAERSHRQFAGQQ